MLTLCAEMTSSYGISDKVCVQDDGGRVELLDKLLESDTAIPVRWALGPSDCCMLPESVIPKVSDWTPPRTLGI